MNAKSPICLFFLIGCLSCSRSNVPSSVQAEKLSSTAYEEIQSGDYAGAIANCNKAIKIDSSCWQAFDNRGVARGMQSDFSRAIGDFDKAIQLNPNSPTLYSDRGFAKKELKIFQGALADFNKAIELDPKDARIYLNRASIKYELNDLDGAESDYKRALKLDSRSDKIVGIAQEGIALIEKARTN